MVPNVVWRPPACIVLGPGLPLLLTTGPGCLAAFVPALRWAIQQHGVGVPPA